MNLDTPLQPRILLISVSCSNEGQWDLHIIHCTYQGDVELGWVWPSEGFAVVEQVESGTYLQLAVGQRGVKMTTELGIALMELKRDICGHGY